MKSSFQRLTPACLPASKYIVCLGAHTVLILHASMEVKSKASFHHKAERTGVPFEHGNLELGGSKEAFRGLPPYKLQLVQQILGSLPAISDKSSSVHIPNLCFSCLSAEEPSIPCTAASVGQGTARDGATQQTMV